MIGKRIRYTGPLVRFHNRPGKVIGIARNGWLLVTFEGTNYITKIAQIHAEVEK